MDLPTAQKTYHANPATREHWAQPGSGWTSLVYAAHIFTWNSNPTFRVILSDK